MSKNQLLQFISINDVQVEEMPWGPLEWLCRPGLTKAEKLMLARVAMPVGAGHKFHRHPAMEEIIYVVSGKAEQWIHRDKQILESGEAAHIPTNVVHGTYNVGEVDLVFLAIFSPAIFDGPALIDVSKDNDWAHLR